MKILAIIPVYRDIATAIKVLKKFRKGYVDQIFLTIDAPPCDEQKIRKIVAKTAVPVFVAVNSERKGVGSAIRNGIKYGLSKSFDVGVVLAGNDKDNPHEIKRLLSPILYEGVDYVQGSRFLPGGRKVNNPLIRGVFSRLYPFAWTLLTKRMCTDVTNGFRAFRFSIFRDIRINIDQDWLNDYQLEYYIHYKALSLGFVTKEVPVSKIYAFKHKGGYSNISPLLDWWEIVSPLLYLALGVRT